MFFRHVRLYVGNKRGYQFAVPAFGLFLFVFDVSLCVFSFCLLLRMFSILQCGCLFGLLVSRDLVFYTTLQVFSRMLRWLVEHPEYFIQVFLFLLRWKSWAREHGLTVFPASPFHFAIYLRHLMNEARQHLP